MTPRELSAVPVDAELVVFAKDQPEYLPLPAARFADGRIYTEWKPDEDELARLQRGEAVRLWIWTFNGPLQPVALEVTSEHE